ncbi:MAG: YceI family protein [Azospirillaceae bacterium]
MLDRILPAAVLALALATAPGGPAAAAPAEWTVIHEDSRLGFEATQGGDTFEGRFADWRADIAFSPDDLAASAVTVEVAIDSFDANSRDRNSTAMNDQWFDAEEHPTAVFETRAFRHLDGDSYEAVADLTIKGVSRELVLPFTLQIDGDTARMDGSATILRTNWNVGTGDWASGDTVGLEVRVVVDLVAERAG